MLEIIILSIVTVFAFVSCEPSQQLPSVVEPVAHSYELVLQWGNSFCNSQTDGVRCREPVPQHFTIHGLWPYDVHDKILPSCEFGVDLSRENVKSIKWLAKNWRNQLHEDEFLLWHQQWRKHVRCLNLEPKDYFKKTIALKRYIDKQLGGSLIQFFESEDLPPSDVETYDGQSFPEKIFNYINYVTKVRCNLDSNGHVQLYEVRFCITRDRRWVKNCSYAGNTEGSYYDASNCFTKDSRIRFPPALLPPPPPPPSPKNESQIKSPPPPPPSPSNVTRTSTSVTYAQILVANLGVSGRRTSTNIYHAERSLKDWSLIKKLYIALTVGFPCALLNSVIKRCRRRRQTCP